MSFLRRAHTDLTPPLHNSLASWLLPSLCSFLLGILLFTLPAQATASDYGDEPKGDELKYPMAARVWCDPVAGISFRYPYEWLCADQVTGALHRPNGPNTSLYSRMSGTQWSIIDGKPQFDVRPFSYLNDQLPAGLNAQSSLSEIGNAIAESVLTWENWDYYRSSPRRPFAAKNFAPLGITGAIGHDDQGCCLILKHGNRYSGVRLSGAPDNPELKNTIILDSFEVLSKSGGGSRAMTWRENQCKKNQVACADDRMVTSIPSGKAKPTTWANAWQIETEHYHITANRSPARLAFLGLYFEALWRSYSKVFLPTSMPPIKSEVHIFERASEFEGCSKEWQSPTFVVRHGNEIMGGFFSPLHLSMFLYEENEALVGPTGSVEHVSAHECTHQFVHLACNGSHHVPTWLNEGLAVYFENGVLRNGEFQTKLPIKRLEQLKTTYAQTKSTLWPLDKYLDYHGGIPADNYGEVFAMTYFWVFSDQNSPKKPGVKNGKDRFQEYWNALKEKEDGSQAFERIFMADMIAAQGSREAAIKLWSKKLLDYVKNGLK